MNPLLAAKIAHTFEQASRQTALLARAAAQGNTALLIAIQEVELEQIESHPAPTANIGRGDAAN
jgi:hypothetical protein